MHSNAHRQPQVTMLILFGHWTKGRFYGAVSKMPIIAC